MLSKYLNLFFIFIKQIYFYTSIGFGIEEFNLNSLKKIYENQIQY